VGCSTNIIEAAGRALLEVINRIELSQKSVRQGAGQREKTTPLAHNVI